MSGWSGFDTELDDIDLKNWHLFCKYKLDWAKMENLLGWLPGWIPPSYGSP